MPIEHVEFYSQTGLFKLSGTVRGDGEAVINFSRDPKRAALGFFCPVCGELLTEDVHTARRILIEEGEANQNPEESS